MKTPVRHISDTYIRLPSTINTLAGRQAGRQAGRHGYAQLPKVSVVVLSSLYAYELVCSGHFRSHRVNSIM